MAAGHADNFPDKPQLADADHFVHLGARKTGGRDHGAAYSGDNAASGRHGGRPSRGNIVEGRVLSRPLGRDLVAQFRP